MNAPSFGALNAQLRTWRGLVHWLTMISVIVSDNDFSPGVEWPTSMNSIPFIGW